MVKITLEGDAELKAALAKIQGEIPQEVSNAVLATALEIQSDVKKRIQRGPASGRVYVKSSPKRTHQASAPGQAPATDTGRLVNSVMFDQVDKVTAEVSSVVRYASWLEFGTFKMAARPAWRPAVEKARPKFLARMTTAIDRVLK